MESTRRGFLGALGATGALAALSGGIRPRDPSEREKLLRLMGEVYDAAPADAERLFVSTRWLAPSTKVGHGVGTGMRQLSVGGPESVHSYHLTYLSLWYTLGREYGYHDGEWQTIGGSDSADTVIIASEPLTRDVSTWLEVPEYSMLCANTSDGKPRVFLDYLEV